MPDLKLKIIDISHFMFLAYKMNVCTICECHIDLILSSKMLAIVLMAMAEIPIHIMRSIICNC